MYQFKYINLNINLTLKVVILQSNIIKFNSEYLSILL